ncbi:hypothetical protein IMZ48_01780 [Candidatus Bathyarchaeota archaeon]|nr:hypothetical protein [Candidatus Bathyarchaeota archaeon]
MPMVWEKDGEAGRGGTRGARFEDGGCCWSWGGGWGVTVGDGWLDGVGLLLLWAWCCCCRLSEPRKRAFLRGGGQRRPFKVEAGG